MYEAPQEPRSELPSGQVLCPDPFPPPLAILPAIQFWSVRKGRLARKKLLAWEVRKRNGLRATLAVEYPGVHNPEGLRHRITMEAKDGRFIQLEPVPKTVIHNLLGEF